jgi:hypothetical protein
MEVKLTRGSVTTVTQLITVEASMLSICVGGVLTLFVKREADRIGVW